MDQEIIDWRVKPEPYLTNMFSLLAIRLGSYWKKDSITQQTSDQFSRNYVDTLGKVEQFIEQVRLNLVPDSEEYEFQLKRNQKQYTEQLTSYFNRLRYVPIWYGTVELSINANIFFGCVDEKAKRFLSKKYKESQLELDSAQPEMLRRKSYLDFMPMDLENYKEELFSTLKYVSYKLSLPEEQERVINWGDKARLDMIRANEYVNKCFVACPNLYVLCMDLGYPVDDEKTNKDTQRNLYGKEGYKKIKDALHRFDHILATNDNVIGHMHKLEFFPPKGYSAFSIFLLNGNIPASEDYWANSIGEQWRLTTNQQGAFHNCNSELGRFSSDSVGHIKKSNNKKRIELLKWVITYAAKSSEFLTASVPQVDLSILFKLGKEPSENSISNQQSKQTKNKKHKPPEKLEDIKIPEHIWKISKTPKSKADKIIGSRINDISVIYPELLTQDKSNLALFIKIEIFMACLNRYDGLGFDDSHYSNLSVFDRFKYGSVIGQQLWDIDRTWGLVELLKWIRSNSSLGHFSTNLLIFFKSLSGSRLYSPIEPSIGQLSTYNDLIIRIRQYLNIKPKSQIVIQRDGWRYEGGIENALDKVFSSLRPPLSTTNQGDELVPEGIETISDLLDIRNKTADDTYGNAKIYVQNIFKQDVLLLGFNFSVSHRTDHIPATLIAKLLDAFREYGKKDKSLKSLIGYIGYQTITDLQSQHARIILFLDANENRSIDSSAKQVIDYWTQLMQKKLVNPAFQKAIHTKLKNNVPNWHQLTTSIEPAPIFNSVEIFTSSACYINTTDKSKQRKLIDKVVLFIVKQPLYNPPIAQGLSKCLLKGHISHSRPTKKTKPAKAKNLADPEVIPTLEGSVTMEETTLPDPVVQVNFEVIDSVLDHPSIDEALSSSAPIKEGSSGNSIPVDVVGEVRQMPFVSPAARMFGLLTNTLMPSSHLNKLNE